MIKKLVISSLVLVVLAAGLLIGGRWWAMSYLAQPLVDKSPASAMSEPLLLTVAPGDNARAVTRRISQHFARHHVLLDYRLAQFLIGVDQLQAGVYEITANDSWKGVWNKLKRGDEKQFQVTLIEGQRFDQWLAKLKQQPYLDSQLTMMNWENKLPFLADYASPEGLFLPETYNYPAQTTDVALLEKAHTALQQALAQQWQQRSSTCPVETPYELLILASIIEKETGQAGERALVASVFCNRLVAGMRLQSDPTTIYGIEAFDGNLTRQHLREKTPYNTYRIDGLPPTPIAMVSVASLRAAARPESSDYFYFVADNRGGHVFSKTLAEHNRAVREYQIKPHQQDKD